MEGSTKKGLPQLESTLDLYLGQKAPALPSDIKKLIVNLAPWITLVSIILAAPPLLAMLGISFYVTPWAYMAGWRAGTLYYLSLGFLAAMLAIRVIALPGLFAQSRGAWKLLYYSVLINLVYVLFSYAIVGGLIGALVSLYFLFQVKRYYK